MSAELCESVHTRVRYETPNHLGETRRERNVRYEMPSPDSEPPAEGLYLWEWFWSLSNQRSFGENSPEALSLTDIKSWCELYDTKLAPYELDVILNMDAVFLSAMSDEIKNNRAIQEDSWSN